MRDAFNDSIVRQTLTTERDVVSSRLGALRLAEAVGLERRDQTRFATAVSELARNAFIHAGGGEIAFAVALDAEPQRLLARIIDHGPGIADIDGAMNGPSGKDMPHGLVAARRLLDYFEIRSRPEIGTTVDVGVTLPPVARRLTQDRLKEVGSLLKKQRSSDPLEAQREQNLELARALDDLRKREEETRQLTQELADTNRGVIALYAELEERAEQLRKASELKSRFLSHLSHEFRTPLNSIVALARLLIDRVDGDLGSEQERQVGYIRRSAESLLELVNDMLDLAKAEAGKSTAKPVVFSAPELFGTLRGALKPLLVNPEVELTFQIGADMPPLFTDEAKVAQILRNLISNALKFTEHGVVRVTAELDAESGNVNFSVADTGIGIAGENLERVFDEFFQIDTKLHGRVKGTGLGLSLSRSLAKILQGSLTVESQVNRGSTFTLSVPVSLVEEPRAEALPSSGPRRVLLIDDDETFRYVMRKILNGETDCQLLEANDGEAGVRVAVDHMPDLIILDIQMPGIDGFETLARLRADARTANTAVVVCTSATIDAALKMKLPPDTRIIPKSAISRESVVAMVTEVLEDSA